MIRFRLLGCITMVAARAVCAQVAHPPVNLGGTSIMDGVAGPGILLEPGVMEHYSASRFTDANGETIPGRNNIDTWVNIAHVGYITTHKVAGGFYGMELLVPSALIDINTSFGPKGSVSGLGDILISPLIIEWPDRKLLGKTFFSRFSVVAELPTGAYDPAQSVNTGSNAGGAFAYYAFTILPSPKTETSWRLNYRWNGENQSPFTPLGARSTQAGQSVHMNYAFSYALSPAIRAGMNGYALQQIGDHRLNGVRLANSRERVVALGPAVMWTSGFWGLIANADHEMLARNRPEGYRVNITVRRVFPHNARQSQ